MSRKVHVYIHRDRSPTAVFALMVVLAALMGLIGSRNRAARVSRMSDCLTKLEESGFTSSEIHRLTDGEVAKVCGFLPGIPVNSAWKRNRERPVGIAEKAKEMEECAAKFEERGLSFTDMQQSSASEAAIICDAAPALL